MSSAFSLGLASLVGFAVAVDVHQRSEFRKSHINRANSLEKRFSGQGMFHGQGTLQKRFSGQGTYFLDGLGACGEWSKPSDFIVALNTCQYDGGAYCHKQLVIHAQGRSTTATVMDECPTCGCGSLDFSQGLFEFFADLGVGVLDISWQWAGAAPATTSKPHTRTQPKTTTHSSTTKSSSSSSSSVATTTSMTTRAHTWSKTWSSNSAAPTTGISQVADGNIPATQQLVYLFGALASYGKAQC